MNLAQENFERACTSGRPTLDDLRTPPDLSRISKRKLESMAWDLEAIQSALRMEINQRYGRDIG